MVSEWAEERKLMVIDTNIVRGICMLSTVFLEWYVRVCGSKTEGASLIISIDA
jgi:hypothetical protein